MAGRDRVAALQRARQRQRRVEEQTARTTKAYAAVDRAKTGRERALERLDRKVAEAADAAHREAAQLVEVCGSSAAAAEILGVDIRELRRAVISAERTNVG
jgi:hypothetical protein